MSTNAITKMDLDDLYSELIKDYNSGEIRPTPNTQVKTTIEENGILGNIFGFIKNKLGGQ